jgi:hypothetical protein
MQVQRSRARRLRKGLTGGFAMIALLSTSTDALGQSAVPRDTVASAAFAARDPEPHPLSVPCQAAQAVLAEQPVRAVGAGRVVASQPRLSDRTLASFIQDLASSLGVPTGLAHELASVVVSEHHVGWNPDCAWTITSTGFDNEFTRPVVTANGRLAVMEWATYGLGKVCLAYRPSETWTVKCALSWEH